MRLEWTMFSFEMFYGRDPKVGIKYKVYFTRKRFYYLNEKILFKNGRFCSRAHYDYEVRMQCCHI